MITSVGCNGAILKNSERILRQDVSESALFTPDSSNPLTDGLALFTSTPITEHVGRKTAQHVKLQNLSEVLWNDWGDFRDSILFSCWLNLQCRLGEVLVKSGNIEKKRWFLGLVTDMWGPVVQWFVQRIRSERLRVRSRRSATFTPSAHVRRQSLPVWPPTLNKIPLPLPLHGGACKRGSAKKEYGSGKKCIVNLGLMNDEDSWSLSLWRIKWNYKS